VSFINGSVKILFLYECDVEEEVEEE